MEPIIQHRRAEDIERAAWEHLFDAAPPRIRARLGLRAEHVEGALVLRATGLDHLLFNRAIGLGTHGPVEPEAVRAVVDTYRRSGIPRFFVHLPAAERAGPLAARLEDSGLTRFHRSWVKLVRDARVPPRSGPTELTVVRAGPSLARDAAALWAHGLDLPGDAVPVLASVVGSAGWHVYVALEGARVVAAGALYVRDRLGTLFLAATDPAYRRRGAQGALVARRVRTAWELGCELLATETGEAAPGDPQHSYHNLVRHGFEPAFVRDNWGPAEARWGAPVT